MIDPVRRPIGAVAVAIGAVAAALLAPGPARAHPHVWVVTAGTLQVGPDGALTGIRFAWEFDEAYSSVAVMGQDKNGDGKLTRDELASLAKTNAEALKEFEYFTFAKVGSRKLKFGEPVDYYLEQDDRQLLTLHFTLPLDKPQPMKGTLRVEVYDPTMFVAFAFADGAAAFSAGTAPAGCTLTVERPQPLQPGQPLSLSEAFFNSLTASSNYGAQFANRATVKCP